MLGSFPLFSDFKLGRFAGGGMRRAVATFPRLCKPRLGMTEDLTASTDFPLYLSNRLRVEYLLFPSLPLVICPKRSDIAMKCHLGRTFSRHHSRSAWSGSAGATGPADGGGAAVGRGGGGMAADCEAAARLLARSLPPSRARSSLAPSLEPRSLRLAAHLPLALGSPPPACRRPRLLRPPPPAAARSRASARAAPPAAPPGLRGPSKGGGGGRIPGRLGGRDPREAGGKGTGEGAVGGAGVPAPIIFLKQQMLLGQYSIKLLAINHKVIYDYMASRYLVFVLLRKT